MRRFYYRHYYDKKNDAEDYLYSMFMREKGLRKELRNCRPDDYGRILLLESQIKFVQQKIVEQCRYLDTLINNTKKYD